MENASHAKRVLVVDDEKNIRLTLQQVLEDEGWHVETATDGGEGLDALRQSPAFDLMLLDLRMPGTDGMAVLRQMQELDDAPPVVVFTAHGSAENATEAMKLGATDFAEKPFSPSQIRALAERFGAGGEAPEEERPPEEAAPSAPAKKAHAHRTLLLLPSAADADALLTLAAASAHSHARGEVLVVALEPDDGAETADLAALAKQEQELGVPIRTRTAEGTRPADALPALVEDETPDHVMLPWSGPPAEARALDTLAGQVAGEAGCEVTLARPGHQPASPQRIAAVVSRAAHALVAVRRALELAKSAGVASLTLLSAQSVPAEGDEDRLDRDGRALIRQVARQAGLAEHQYRAHVTVSTDARALARAAEDFDTLCASPAHADELVPALFGDDEGSGRIRGTVALVRGPEHEEPTILESLVSRLTGA